MIFLGNDQLAALTAARRYKLRVDLRDWEGNVTYAEYSKFNIADCGDKYRLVVGEYSGDAGLYALAHYIRVSL